MSWATSTARRATIMSRLWLPGRTRWCPRSGRDGHAAAHIDQGALRQQVQRGIERMQAVVTAPRAAQTHNLHRAGGRFGVAILLAPRRALHTTGVLGRTGNLSRAALVVMSLQELAYQLLAPPVQFPFEFALAHLPGFVGGEESHRRWDGRTPDEAYGTSPSRSGGVHSLAASRSSRLSRSELVAGAVRTHPLVSELVVRTHGSVAPGSERTRTNRFSERRRRQPRACTLSLQGRCEATTRGGVTRAVRRNRRCFLPGDRRYRDALPGRE